MAVVAEESFARVPPQDIAAEQAVFGAILLDNDVINQVVEFVSAEDFYRESHREIFRAMIELTERIQPVDAITLTDALRGRGILESIGGPAYIAELVTCVPVAGNASHYARIVFEKSVLRTLSVTAREIASACYEHPANVDEFVDQAESRIFQIAERRIRRAFASMNELAKASLAMIERLFERRELVTGVPTGFLDLDRITAGFQPSDLIVIAARPSMGKTALALNIAAYASMVADPPVGVAFFSLEMSKEQLALRMLCSEARVDLSKARTGTFAGADFGRLAEAASRLSEAPIYIDDSSDITPIGLKAKCRRLKRERSANLGLVIVDYMQLMRAARPNDSREKEIAEISRSLKALAKELKLPVVALSQLNRAVETRPERRPLLADLRESGAIEQDADVVAFVYRDEVYHHDTKEPGVAEIIVAKQRNGPTDMARLTWLKQFTRFENYTGESSIFENAEG